MRHQEEQDKLLQAIRAEAALERDAILAKAQLQIDEIEAQTRDETEQIHAQIEAKVRQSLQLERDRLAGQSQAACRLTLQASRMRWIEKAFDEARQTILAMSESPQYPGILGALIVEALDVVGHDGQVSVAASEVKSCRTWLGRQGVSCDLQGIESGPGTVLAATTDGTRRVDNSLMTRLSRVESLCRHQVAAILFEDVPASREES